MHTEMKYRFLIHYTLSFIGGYLGLCPLCQERSFRQCPRQPIFLCCAGSHRQGIFWICFCVWLRFSLYMAAVISRSGSQIISPDLRFISIGIDIFAILLLGFFPAGMSPVVALYLFFCNAFQWCAFKAPGGYNSSTIFSTNNLRQFTRLSLSSL